MMMAITLVVLWLSIALTYWWMDRRCARMLAECREVLAKAEKLHAEIFKETTGQ